MPSTSTLHTSTVLSDQVGERPVTVAHVEARHDAARAAARAASVPIATTTVKARRKTRQALLAHRQQRGHAKRRARRMLTRLEAREVRLDAERRQARRDRAQTRRRKRREAERTEQRITRAQRALEDLGYEPGPIDGTYGRRTRHAVREFQRVNDLAVDGVYGPNTQRALQSDDASPYEPPPPPEPDPDDEPTDEDHEPPEPEPTSDPRRDPEPAPAEPAPAEPAPAEPSDEARYEAIADRYCPTRIDVVVDHPLLDGHDGTANPWEDEIYAASGLSDAYATYVIAHECAHVRDVDVHGRLSNDYEAVADCVTVRWGLDHQNYTTSCDGVEQAVNRIVD